MEGSVPWCPLHHRWETRLRVTKWQSPGLQGWGKSRNWSPLSWGLPISFIILWEGSGREAVKRMGEVAGVSHLPSANKVSVPPDPLHLNWSREGLDACSLAPTLRPCLNLQQGWEQKPLGLSAKQVLKGQYQELLTRNPGGSGEREERALRKGLSPSGCLLEPWWERAISIRLRVRLLPLVWDTGTEPLLYTSIALGFS